MSNVPTDFEIAQLAERNRQRAEELKQQLGTRYAHHPDNFVRRREASVQWMPARHPRLSSVPR